ncbi:hypothetical protein IU501_34000 [Nocardia otitidiscaviarum]|uniref:hypothetical protein n=1 Tax=Nocardia otitidiscaviarum TaxID=1823 RepID=UPI000693C1B9|nr:hypothetical protein [Nocardia otitidiscaviarum]MBF6137985.1 hypothetical protein [Nocardia otitidiscaviarum]MBF6488984.1 hypothetical protein [Nocardia otitidiscaviarum]
MTEQRSISLAVDRRTLLRRLGFAVGIGAVLGACDDDGLPGMGDGNGMDDMGGDMPGWMMDDGMMDGSMMGDMRVIRALLTGHEDIRREVEDIDGGIRSITTSTDPRLAGLIREHVLAMRARIAENRPIRHGDPVFREIFEHHDALHLEPAELADGMRVIETSPDPQVVLLIRQHAHRAVSEFVESGMSRAMRPTPLPDGYRG